MPTLGKENVRVVVDHDDTEESAGRVYYRDATAEEWAKFQGELAEMTVGGNTRGERLSTLCHRFGGLVVTRAEGFDVPDGMGQAEALCQFAPDIVAEIGQHVFVNGGGRKLELGKSAKPPASTSADGSAPSSEESAST